MKYKKKLKIIILIISLLVLIPATVFGQSDINIINNISEYESEKIEKFISEQIDKGRIPGVAIAVVKEGDTIYQKGFGYSNKEKGEKVTPSTLFEIGSNSKAFTALGILQLEEEGLLNINDPVKKYIPWLNLKIDGKNIDVKLEQFMHHTSGVPHETIYDIPISTSEDALKNTVETLNNKELKHKPGSNYEYATINYDVLGLVIESVTGKTYNEYIKENILIPLNMNNTYFSREECKEKLSQGYKRGFFNTIEYDAPIYKGNTPAGYIISNIEDMSKWANVQLGYGEESEINKEIIDKSHEIDDERDFLNNQIIYAAGWEIDKYFNNRIMHGGDNPNYSSYIVMDPNSKVAVIVLGNIQSTYIRNIGNGILSIIEDKVPNTKIKDFNKTIDLIASMIIILVIILILIILILFLKGIAEIFTKRRKFSVVTVKGVAVFIISVVFMLFINYCIYLLPKALLGITNWNFLLIWLPISIKYVVLLIITFIWLAYIYIIFIEVFKNNKKKSLFEIIVLSILSGFGNSLIIFTINKALRDKELHIDIGIYFILGIILYVYGQRLVRMRLIKYTTNAVYLKRIEIINKILKASYDEYEKIENGKIHSTLNNDTERIGNFANDVMIGVTSAITMVFCSIYLGFLSWKALILSLSVILLIAAIYMLVIKKSNNIFEQVRDTQNIFFRFINDLTDGFKELALNYKRKNEFEEDMKEICCTYKRKSAQADMAFANVFVVGELVFTLAIGAVVFIFPIIINGMDKVTLSTYVFILLFMTGPVNNLLNTVPNLIRINVSWKRINEMLKEVGKIGSMDLSENNLISCNQLNSEISILLDEVEYKYNTDEDKSFKVGPINYEFKSGEITFVTGGNGSGKSTLAKLMTGLYKPTSGSILLNNEHVLEFILNQQYTAVFSDFHLFNKLYGIDCDNKREDIEKYLTVLGLNEKVEVHNNTFSTINLSTGQKKRLALLITYLEDKPIYLFDEWAADQDPEFRKFFYEVLLPDLKKRKKCVIAITHDEHYFNACDKIIKMDMGKLEEVIK